MHEFGAGQDTQNSWPVGTRGFGLGVRDHPPGATLAGAVEAPISMVAAAVARQAAARPATADAATLRGRRGSVPGGQGPRCPAGLIGCCCDRAATRPILEMTPSMMDPPSVPIPVRAVLRLGRHKKLTSQARAPFCPLSARARAVLDCAWGEWN